MYPWLSISTAILCWCIGRYLSPSWLQWLVLFWCLALLDLISFSAQAIIRDRFVGYVLLASQISLLIVWCWLGPWKWQWKLPVVLVAAATIVIESRSVTYSWVGDSWNAVLILAACVVAALCFTLRLTGFSIRRKVFDESADVATQAALVSQFGLKHMFIWATALVPLLLIARGLDSGFLSAFTEGQIFASVLLAVAIALINLASIWCVLGRGSLAARGIVLLALPTLLGILLNYYASALRAAFPNWRHPTIVAIYFNVEGRWIVWLVLNAAMTAALLLFLRGSGYNLYRLRPKSISVGNGK